MPVVIYDATGNIGSLTVNKALQAEHEVTAFARSPVKLRPDSLFKALLIIFKLPR